MERTQALGRKTGRDRKGESKDSPEIPDREKYIPHPWPPFSTMGLAVVVRAGTGPKGFLHCTTLRATKHKR